MSTNKQVVEAVETMTAAFHAGDIVGVMASYEDQATIVFEPGSAPITDRGAQQKMFEQLFELKPAFSYGGHEVFATGETAIHIAPWSMTGTAPDGTQIEQSGLSVAVLRRQADNRWLIIIDNPHGEHTANSD